MRARSHYSTLVQQVLSAIAQFGGVKALEIWKAYCRSGPFERVDQSMFANLLRSIAAHDLIVQERDNTLLLGEAGERIVNHYSFYTAFQTSEEYRVMFNAKLLGSLPLTFGVGEDALIVFAGRRWRVVDVDDDAKVLMVEPAPGGNPPRFDGGELGMIHRAVRREMREVYESKEVPIYLDAIGQRLLDEGRSNYFALNLDKRGLLRQGDSIYLFPWAGDQSHNALALLLRSRGLDAAFDGLTVSVHGHSEADVLIALNECCEQSQVAPHVLALEVENLQYEKYDHFLPDELLRREFAAKRLDVEGAIACARSLSTCQ